MATLKILRCKNCTAPLPAGTTTCPKCHAVNLVQSEVNPLQLPSNLTNDYIEFFKQQTEANPKDTNAHSVGLVNPRPEISQVETYSVKRSVSSGEMPQRPVLT